MQAEAETFETAFASEDEKAADEQQRQRAALQDLIASRLRRAVDARITSGIEEIWQEDDEQYNGIEFDDSPPNQAPSGKSQNNQAAVANPAKRSRIYVNITKPKTDVGVARVQELLVPHDDKPWEIEPTPVPDIDEAIAAQDQRMLTTADGQQKPAVDVARALYEKSRLAAEKASDQIEDWFVEGRIYPQWRRVIHDAGRIGTGVLKGPLPTMRKDRKWDAQSGVLKINERLAPISKAISAWDLFPDPSCGEDIHEGAFCIERDYLTGRSVRALAKLPDYDAEAIAEILKEGPRTNGRFDDRYRREKRGQVGSFDTDVYETFYYYGDIPPATLIAGGWVIADVLDAQDEASMAQQIDTLMQLVTVPVVVTLINDRIVRITMNPLETGDFPFDVFVWEPVEGQPWGRGIPRKMQPAQKMLNASTRAMLENAGMAAGPQLVIDKKRISPANGRYDINGRKLWYFDTEEPVDVRFAFQVVNIPSAQEQLQNIIKYALEMADQLTNLPLMMQGDMGAAPDTVGGMAMLEANAVSPLKVIAKAYDDHLVIPHLSRYYTWLMQDENVPTDAKGDMQIRARGSSALVLRDTYAQILPQMLPLVKDPAFKLDPEKYIEQLLRSSKLDPKSLKLTAEQADAQAKAAAENPPMAPQVEAAHIRAETQKASDEASAQRQAAELQWKAEQAAMDRVLEKYVKEIEFQIQSMEFADRKDISFEQLRTILATKAMDIKNQREMFVAERDLKLDPENKSHLGV